MPRRNSILALVSALLILLASLYFSSKDGKMSSNPSEFKVRYVSGYFEHDQQPTGPDQDFRAHTLPAFGILRQSYKTDLPTDQTKPQWERFESLVKQHNADETAVNKIRVLFVGRHGEGVHNVKEREVGRHEWDRYWSKENGDGNVVWLDARLTEKGRQQATDLAKVWQTALRETNVPAPERYYVSPLTRCLETARLTYSELDLPSHKRFRPVVKEALREINGEHTCDKRSSKSYIQSNFPEFQIEPDFSEEDELWKPDWRETLDERLPWIHQFLERLFDEDEATFISITTHTGVIRAICQSIGHPDVWVAAGAIVPIVIQQQVS